MSMYSSQLSFHPHAFDEATWQHAGPQPIPHRRYASGWGQEQRRSPADLVDNSFQQAFLSDCRTTISPVDSPAYQALLLPTDMGTISSHAHHVPRGMGGFLDSSSSTDSDEGSDPTPYGYHGYHPYSGRGSPHNSRLSMSSRSSTSSPDWPGLNLQISAFDAQNSWNSMLLSAADSSITPYTPQQTMSLNGFAFPHRFSPVSSPSPPPAYNNSLSIPAAKPTTTTLSTRGANRDAHGVKKCSHCQATSTPLWRRDPSTQKPLCNACGLYLQQRNRLRPQELIDADIDDGSADEVDQNYVGPECSHCRTHHTSVWRRSKTGAQLCNACGVYQRLRGKPRPLSLKRSKIKPRTKHPKN